MDCVKQMAQFGLLHKVESLPFVKQEWDGHALQAAGVGGHRPDGLET